MTPLYVGVIGTGEHDDATAAAAEEVGRLLAERGAVVVCGGLGAVMEAACRGATSAGGTTVGVLPGRRRADGNAHLSVALTTGLGEMRNPLIVRSVDVVIAIGGGFGTLSEIGFALKIGRPVVGLMTWDLDAAGAHGAVRAAAGPAEAVEAAFAAVRH